MLPAKELMALMEAVVYYIAGNSNSIQVLLSENGERNFQKNRPVFYRPYAAIQKSPDSILIDERILNYYSAFFREGCIAMLQEWFKNGMDMSIRDMAKTLAKLVRSVLGQGLELVPKTREKMDLLNNPVGYFTSPGKMVRILLFSSGCCLKLQFLNNSIVF
jgi:hypothetical protein